MNARRYGRGFTLIELLVVVAIIALLIAILLPSLGRARDRAKTTACLSNVRSLAQAATVYANLENNAVVPAATVYNGATDLGFFTLIVEGCLPNLPLNAPSNFAANSGGASNPEAGTHFPNLSYRSVFVCPATLNVDLSQSPDQTQGRDGFWQGYDQIWNNALTIAPITSTNALFLQCSYGMNGTNSNPFQPGQFLDPANANNSGDLGRTRRMTEIAAPSSMVFMYDGLTINPQGGGAAPADVIKRRIAGRHDHPNLTQAGEGMTGTTNIAFYDGHAENVARNKLPNSPIEFGYTSGSSGPASAAASLKMILQNHPFPHWRLDEE